MEIVLLVIIASVLLGIIAVLLLEKQDLKKEIEEKNDQIKYFEDIHNTTMIYHLKNALKISEEREDYESAAYFSNLIGEIESGNAKASFS